jgi:hypothetical protein
MSRFLNASTSLEFSNERVYTSGNAFAPNLLGMQGYTTFGVFPSDYYFGTNQPIWDVFSPTIKGNRSYSPLARGILQGEFRADASFNAMDYEDYILTKRQYLSANSDSPIFFYTHNQYPGHSQNSGRCLPDETIQFAERLEIANEEMEQDALAVIAARPNSIVVIASDHGPYLTKNCTGLGNFSGDEIERLDIQDRYGAFLAIRWSNDVTPAYDLQVLQEVLPAVFSEASGRSNYWDHRDIPKSTLGFASGPVRVVDGYIVGGQHDGQPLFLERSRR